MEGRLKELSKRCGEKWRQCRVKSAGFEESSEEVGLVFLLSRHMMAVSEVSMGAGVTVNEVCGCVCAPREREKKEKTLSPI